ncbi:hypothetical protein HaLaN_27622 [Haematococcus lacustris]|uniref:Uncharacterized protein n=1 Tax=Haematococcus lacustris TaxID=44745 RepID=A0A6A0A8Z5_HAELA|nr:hypothetical protein HaLaN_27622 [Haematococcus lacustris]
MQTAWCCPHAASVTPGGGACRACGVERSWDPQVSSSSGATTDRQVPATFTHMLVMALRVKNMW